MLAAAGRATRLTRFYLESEKTYCAQIALGFTTDTLDADSEPVALGDVSALNADMITAAVKSFLGEQDQLPPLYSALKIGGKRASDIVRAGGEIDLAPRRISIHEIAVDAIAQDCSSVAVTLRCSRGTYVRSLARDLGSCLGVGAYLTGLRRTASGVFSVTDAADPDRIAQGAGTGDSWYLTMEDAVRGLGRMDFSAADANRIKNGLRIPADSAISREGAGSAWALFDPDKKLIAIAEVDTENGLTRYLAVFN